MSKNSTYRIPEAEVAVAFNAMANFKAALLRGASSQVAAIDDTVVAFTTTEIVAGSRAQLQSRFSKEAAALIVLDKSLRVAYDDLYEIFFGEEYADEMIQSMGLSIILLREQEKAVEQGSCAEAVETAKELEEKFISVMYMVAIAYLMAR